MTDTKKMIDGLNENYNPKEDLISEKEANDIQKENEAYLTNATTGYDRERLRKQFEGRSLFNKRKKYGDRRHAEKLKGTQDGEYNVYQAPEMPTISFDEAKRVFWFIYKSILKKTPILTENNRLQLNDIVHWLINEGPFKTNKGLFIFGDYGRGKSELITSMYLFSIKGKKRFANIKKLPLAKEYKFMMEKAKKGLPIKGLYMIDRPVTIDDLGFKEESQLKLWGNKEDIVTNIIYTRHSIWKRDENHFSLFTSNLSPEDILKNQGEGVSSRLQEMTNLIFWDGDVNFRTV